MTPVPIKRKKDINWRWSRFMPQRLSIARKMLRNWINLFSWITWSWAILTLTNNNIACGSAVEMYGTDSQNKKRTNFRRLGRKSLPENQKKKEKHAEEISPWNKNMRLALSSHRHFTKPKNNPVFGLFCYSSLLEQWLSVYFSTPSFVCLCRRKEKK